MDTGKESPHVAPFSHNKDILNCWKDISAYLERDVRTVMRWEHTRSLPVHRLPGGPKSAVYAFKSELEAWRAAGAMSRPKLEGIEPFTDSAGNAQKEEPPRAERSLSRQVLLGAAMVLLALVAVILGHFAWKARSTSAPLIKSVAVLPLKNLSGDPAQVYLADTVHENLITNLARANKLRVISRTSVAQYRDTTTPGKQIAQQLDVDAFVEGSVLRIGNRVRITAQLIRCDNDQHVWAASYDRDLIDLFALTDEVSQAITNEIGFTLRDRTPPRPVGKSKPVPPEALDLYLRAQYSFHSMTREGFEAALPLYRNALAVNSEFPLAWRGLAMTRLAQVWFGYLPASDGLAEARTAANEAVRLDDRLGEAHGVLGYIALYFDWDFETARKFLERAVELSPNSPMVRHQYADYLMVNGQMDQSLEQARFGHASDPLSFPPRYILLYHSLMARRYEDVLSEGHKMLAAKSATPGIHDVMARALWLQGLYEEAISEWTVTSPDSDERARTERLYRLSGPRAVLIFNAEKAAVRARSRRQEAYDVASWFAAANDANQALQWLELSYRNREPRLLHVVADPFFDPIRTDRRFGELLRRIGVPSATTVPRRPEQGN